MQVGAIDLNRRDSASAIDPFDFAQGRPSIAGAVRVNRPYLIAALPMALLQLEGSAAYNLVIDQNVHAVGADAECARAEPQPSGLQLVTDNEP